MTANQGFVRPTRRPGELGVHSLDHFHFVVPDLAVASRFYSEFGLEVGERDAGLTLATQGNPHVWGTIGEGPRKKHQYLSFGVFEDDLDRFAERLQALHVKRVDPPAGVESNGLWLHDPDGALIEIAAAPKTSPSEKVRSSSHPSLPSSAGRRTAAPPAAPFRAGWRMCCCSPPR